MSAEDVMVRHHPAGTPEVPGGCDASVISVRDEDAYWAAKSAAEDVPLTGARRQPCGTCPWHLKYVTGSQPNPNFPDPGIVEEVWKGAHRGHREEDGGARGGLLVMCHRGNHTDMPEWLQDYDQYAVCASAFSVQQREAIRWHEGTPSGVGEDAAARIAFRMGVPSRLFLARTLTRDDLLACAHPSIADPNIGHPAMAPLAAGEFDGAVLAVVAVEVEPAMSDAERERVACLPVCVGVREDGAVLVRASSSEVAVAWVEAALERETPADPDSVAGSVVAP
jgi:hypothetical protein